MTVDRFDMAPAPIKVVCAIIIDGNKVLAAKRPGHKDQGGLWEFPGGKLCPNEGPQDGIKREIREELGVDIAILSQHEPVLHHYTNKSIELIAFTVEIVSGTPQPIEHDELAWVDVRQCQMETWCEADRVLMKMLV